MKFTFAREYKKNEHKTLKSGATMNVTKEFYDWLIDNNYDKPIKKVKEKKTNKAQDKEQKIK